MNSTSATLNIESIEEYTLFALDRSQEGLNKLREDCRRCAEALSTRSAEAFSRLSALAGNLYDFDVFQKDIVSFFEIDPANIGDERGTLKGAEDNFRSRLDELAVLLEGSDFKGLADLLTFALPSALDRFSDMFPLLRNYIDVQYLSTTP
ncbi:MAG: hypothetical protein V2A34_00635 [Lentisphaerota bacterium]